MNQSFRTSPIALTPDEFILMESHLAVLRVHPTDFVCKDGMTLQQKVAQEPLDGDSRLGNPIDIDYDPDLGTAVIYADGGLSLAQLQDYYGYTVTTGVMGNVLDDLLSEQFCENHKGIKLFTEERDETGVLDESKSCIYDMDYFHTEEGKKNRAEARVKVLEEELKVIYRQQHNLEIQENQLTNEVEALRQQFGILPFDDSDSLPF